MRPAAAHLFGEQRRLVAEEAERGREEDLPSTAACARWRRGALAQERAVFGQARVASPSRTSLGSTDMVSMLGALPIAACKRNGRLRSLGGECTFEAGGDVVQPGCDQAQRGCPPFCTRLQGCFAHKTHLPGC